MKKTILNKQQKIAKRYAVALSGFEDSSEILKDLYSISEVLEKSPDLKAFLENPIIKKDDKKSVVDEIFKTSFQENVLNFVKLLLDKNRFSYFNSILQVLQTKLDQKNNVARVLVVSAVELKEDEKLKIKQKLEAKLKMNIEPDYDLDESIIAGLVIKIGDKVVDNSVKAKLQMMKRQLI